jgi:hypothetical protein
MKASTERPQKILVAMCRLSNGTTKPLKYEDIVVKAFEMFPDDFALRGHPEYPDSSDIHKPLYGPLKRNGLIRSANKTFALTPRGIEVSKSLIDRAGTSLESSIGTGERLTRDQKTEIDRMLASEAYKLFVNGRQEKILDTDFYTFIGATVRTPKNTFIGRMFASEGAIADASRLEHDQSEDLAGTFAYLRSKFQDLIKRRQEGASGY